MTASTRKEKSGSGVFGEARRTAESRIPEAAPLLGVLISARPRDGGFRIELEFGAVRRIAYHSARSCRGVDRNPGRSGVVCQPPASPMNVAAVSVSWGVVVPIGHEIPRGLQGRAVEQHIQRVIAPLCWHQVARQFAAHNLPGVSINGLDRVDESRLWKDKSQHGLLAYKLGLEIRRSRSRGGFCAAQGGTRFVEARLAPDTASGAPGFFRRNVGLLHVLDLPVPRSDDNPALRIPRHIKGVVDSRARPCRSAVGKQIVAPHPPRYPRRPASTCDRPL